MSWLPPFNNLQTQRRSSPEVHCWVAVFLTWMPRKESVVRYDSPFYSVPGEQIQFILTQFTEVTNIVRVLKIMRMRPAQNDLPRSVRLSFS